MQFSTLSANLDTKSRFLSLVQLWLKRPLFHNVSLKFYLNRPQNSRDVSVLKHSAQTKWTIYSVHLVPSPSIEGEAEIDRVLMKIMLEKY